MTMVNSYAPVLISGATLQTLFIESVSLSLSPPPPSRGPNQPAFIFPTTEKEEKRKRDNDAMIAISFHARVLLFFLFLFEKSSLINHFTRGDKVAISEVDIFGKKKKNRYNGKISIEISVLHSNCSIQVVLGAQEIKIQISE